MLIAVGGVMFPALEVVIQMVETLVNTDLPSSRLISWDSPKRLHIMGAYSSRQPLPALVYCWYRLQRGEQDDEVLAALVGSLGMDALVHHAWQKNGARRWLTTP
jgi:hypothetical protein